MEVVQIFACILSPIIIIVIHCIHVFNYSAHTHTRTHTCMLAFTHLSCEGAASGRGHVSGIYRVLILTSIAYFYITKLEFETFYRHKKSI